MINVDVTCENDNDIITTENTTKAEVRKQNRRTKTHNEGKRLENFFVLFNEICDIRKYFLSHI